MALMSDSWPVKVCRHIPSRTSQSLAEASHAPETNNLVSGARERLITSPVWPANVVVCWPVSISHRALHKNTQTLAFTNLLLTHTRDNIPTTAEAIPSGHTRGSRGVKETCNSPNSPGGVARAGHNLVVIQETAAGQVAWETRQHSQLAAKRNKTHHTVTGKPPKCAPTTRDQSDSMWVTSKKKIFKESHLHLLKCDTFEYSHANYLGIRFYTLLNQVACSLKCHGINGANIQWNT